MYGFPIYNKGQGVVWNSMTPSCLLFSTVNLMAWSKLLICSLKFYLCSSNWMTKVSSTYLNQKPGGSGSSESWSFKVFHVQVGYYGADKGPQGCPFHLFIELTLKGKMSIL